jgi:hypothetical protein
MRKYLFAGAVAGGLLLLGGAPAHADDQPAPAGGVLGGLLNPAGGVDPTGGLDLDSPLGGKVVKVKPGTNSPDLTGAVGDAVPASDGRPMARTGLGDQPANRTPARAATGGGAAKPALPAADVVSEALPTPGGVPALGDLPVGNLLGGGLPLIGGLMPDGRTPSAVPAVRESGLLGGGVPLLGGLLPDDTARTLPAFGETPDASGMPGGGTPVPADDTTRPAVDEPPASTPADAGPGDDTTRLHEEPVDDEAKSKRPFSDGRPVAGEDTEYK